jgi:hypothetical protein
MEVRIVFPDSETANKFMDWLADEGEQQFYNSINDNYLLFDFTDSVDTDEPVITVR